MKLASKTLSAALRGSVALKPGRHSDGRNLYLSVSPQGAMSWVFMYSHNGRRREIGLGSFSGAGKAFQLSLADARAKADEIRLDLSKGVDVLADRKRSKAAANTTFGAQLAAYIDASRAKWAPTTYTKVLGIGSNHLAPLAKKPVVEVDRAAVVDLLKPLRTLLSDTTFQDVRAVIKSVLDYAHAHGHREGLANPADSKIIEKALPTPKDAKGENYASLDYTLVPALFAKLMASAKVLDKVLALTILTASRSGEVRGMLWSELDLERKLWIIPAARMKADTDHVVPLSAPAVAILTSLKTGDDTGLVFSTSKGTEYGAKELRVALGKYHAAEVATVHGMRATFRTYMGDKFAARFSHQSLERCLAHAEDNAVVAAYSRGQYVDERVEIMQVWADYLEGRLASTNVIDIKRAA